MTLDLAAVLRGTHARAFRVLPDGQTSPADYLPGDVQRQIASVQVDSRAAGPGDLFIALPGERVDGHQFVGDALRLGARCAMVQWVPPAESLRDIYRDSGEEWADPRSLLVVPDALLALQNLARSWRLSQTAEIIGITGSIGKTSTKEVVYSLLSQFMPALRSVANLNTEIGLPLMLLRLRPEHRVAVLEMGMYQAGDIALLARVARPRIGIVTNVGPNHLERMGTIERIARAKSELVAALPPDGLAILNGDDEWTRAMARTTGVARTVLVGLSADCHYRATDIESRSLDGMSFALQAEGQSIRLRTTVPGRHLVHAFLFGVAIAREMGIDWTSIADAVALAALEGRQQIIGSQNGLLIIDDSYNAAPASMTAAIQLLSAAPGAKIAVLGDMLELGSQERDAHLMVGRQAAEVAEWLIVRGTRSDWIAQGALEAGLPRERVLTVVSNEDAVRTVRQITERVPIQRAATGLPTMQSATNQQHEPKPEWSVLVKGSRGMRMEEVVHGLRGEG
ncbi:MAG TPA: UDP-N-acetylmuramoyl-tripeptide--D-alanyl-D-alanine ligase [Chloroflexota bacterium]